MEIQNKYLGKTRMQAVIRLNTQRDLKKQAHLNLVIKIK